MKLMHLSDLHLGKRVNEFSMIDDQKYILTKIINIIDDEKPEAVIIAGDIYDKSIPPVEAVELFDDFLFKLSERDLQVFIISGNHDSAERIAFGGRLMDLSGIHMSHVYDGSVDKHILQDEHGNVNIYMLPFIKPVQVRKALDNEEIHSYNEAVEAAVNEITIDQSARNVLVTHQFVTGATRSDSEDISVGGTDNVDVNVFADFDYVALGHIHRPQKIGTDTIRYCGTPLKYSFSEANHKKSVTMVEIGSKGDVNVRTVPLIPKRDLVEIKGTYDEITLKSFYENTSYRNDYMHITLTDEEDVPDAIGKLRVIYPNIMKLDYDNKRTKSNSEISGAEKPEDKSPMELFAEFYKLQNNQEMSDEQRNFIADMIEKIWED